MRLCRHCLMVYIAALTGTHTVRRLTFSDGFHWCEHCVEGTWGASREPARYFIMTLERIEAEKNF